MIRRSAISGLTTALMALGWAALTTQAPPALAHALETKIEALSLITDNSLINGNPVINGKRDINSNRLLLQAQFGDGQPADAAWVRLVPPGGQPITMGRTGPKGELSFALPKDANGDWEVQVDGGPGHRDYLSLPVRGGKADLNQLSEAGPASPRTGLSLLTDISHLTGSNLLPGLSLGAVSGAALLWVQRRRPES